MTPKTPPPLPEKYQKIIDLPHFHDPKRPYMPNKERAAQFIPFKSLEGYHNAIAKKENQV